MLGFPTKTAGVAGSHNERHPRDVTRRHRDRPVRSSPRRCGGGLNALPQATLTAPPRSPRRTRTRARAPGCARTHTLTHAQHCAALRYTDDCPISCKNFLKLCKIKYYHNCLFFNVQKDFMVQSGDPTNSGKARIWPPHGRRSSATARADRGAPFAKF